MQSAETVKTDKLEADWPIYVINLDRAQGRLAEFAADMERHSLSFTRVAAVDGSAIPVDIQQQVTCQARVRRFKRSLSPAEIGCYLSHLKTWYLIACGRSPGGFVLEDDARLRDDAGEYLSLIQTQSSDWDLLKICHDRPPQENRCDITTALIPRRMPPCTIGYAITRAAAGQLITRLIPFSRPIDNDLKYWWEHGACVKITAQSLGQAASDHRRTSAIAVGRAAGAPSPGLLRLWANLRVQTLLHRERIRHYRRRPLHRQWPDEDPTTPQISPALARLLGQDI